MYQRLVRKVCSQERSQEKALGRLCMNPVRSDFFLLIKHLSTCRSFLDFSSWDDDKILAAVLAKSQKEYYEQLSNSSANRNVEN